MLLWFGSFRRFFEVKITKSIRLFILFTVLATFLAGSVLAGRDDKKKKLPVGSYITSAKIEILSLDPERVKLALGYLRDLAEFYGPHSEAYFWTSQIYYDYIDNASSPMDKMQYVKHFVVYSDSLRASCGNTDIKKKYRKGCENLADKVDSISVMLRRQFYNDGAEKYQEVEEARVDMKDDPDSASQVYYREKVEGLRDTAQAFFELAIVLDSTEALPWIGIGNLLVELGELEKANEMLKRALPNVEDEFHASILLQIAYNYINNEQYCESIEFLREYIEGPGSDDVDNMVNMSAIYNRCDKIDSAYYMYQLALEVDSNSIDALVGAGRYHNQQAIWALDSTRHYNDIGETAKGEEWSQNRKNFFQSAKEMLGRAFRVSDSSNTSVAGEYGLVLFLLADYEAAIEPFTRITIQNPGDKDSWTTLGDCYLKLKDFEKCARAYEKVVEIDPDNRPIWESLESLYKELKETENLKKAQEHLK